MVVDPLNNIDMPALSNAVHTRIYIELLDRDEKKLSGENKTPMYESGFAKRITDVRSDGMWVPDYFVYPEGYYKNTIFDLTEKELDLIGKLMVEAIDKI